MNALARNSFGIADCEGAYSTLILLMLEQIHTLQEKCGALEAQIGASLQQFDTMLTTIPGIGAIITATTLSEIGDISRFSSADKLAAYMDVVPAVNQSIAFVGIHVHMSKRGSPYLHRAVWTASVDAIQRDLMFKAHYEKKAAEGLRYISIISYLTICLLLRNGMSLPLSRSTQNGPSFLHYFSSHKHSLYLHIFCLPNKWPAAFSFAPPKSRSEVKNHIKRAGGNRHNCCLLPKSGTQRLTSAHRGSFSSLCLSTCRTPKVGPGLCLELRPSYSRPRCLYLLEQAGFLSPQSPPKRERLKPLPSWPPYRRPVQLSVPLSSS